MGFRNVCALVALFCVPSVFAALGDSCHWTGRGGNGYWTNALNWAEGRVPGRYLAPDADQAGGYATNGVVGEVAVFGDDLANGGATTIDFDGVYSISNLITTGTANRYTYGTSANQYVPLEPWGRLTVAELPNTPVAQLPAKLRAGVEVLAGTWNAAKGAWDSTYGSETVKVRNNSATEEFVFVNTWGHCTRSPLHPSGGGQTGFQIEGTGSFRISETFSGNTPFFRDCLTTGKLVIDTKMATRAFEMNAPGEGFPADSTTVRQIEITANGALGSCEGQQPLMNVNRPVRIYGDGYFAFTAGWVSSSYWNSYGLSLSADATIECMTKFRISNDKTTANWEALANYPYRMTIYPNSSYKLRLTGPTTIGQEVVCPNWTIVEDPAAAIALRQSREYKLTLRADSFADDGPCGPGTFNLIGGATLCHEGAEASAMTRSVVITNFTTGSSSNPEKAARLDQQGAGAWTVSSAVSAAANTTAATLYLSGAVTAGAATFAGGLDEKTTVTHESGNWTFAPANGYCAKLAPKGGQMRLCPGTYTIDEIAPAATGSALLLPSGCTLNVGKLVTAADKTMDFVLLGTDARVYIDPSAANVTTGLRLNGHPAELDTDGHPQLIVGSANVWRLPVDGSWTDLTKWAGGLAIDPFKETFVDVTGNDFAVTLDGVEQTITNFYLGSPNGETVKLVLTNAAHLTVMGRTHLQSILQLKKGARIEAYDSELELFNRGNDLGSGGSQSMLKLNGGALAFHGTAKLKDHGIPMSLRTDGKTENLNGNLYFGTGSVDFYDDATLATEFEEGHTVFYHYFRPDNPGETARVTFHDRAGVNFQGNPYQCYIGGNNGHAVFTYDTSADIKNRGYYQTLVGHSSGVGELIVKGTGSYRVGLNLMQVGTSSASDKSSTTITFVTGRVEVADSALCYVDANSNDGGGFGGITVGQGLPLNMDRGASFLHGELVVKDEGRLEQERGSFIVGGGPNGDGDVTLAGGSIKVVPKAAYVDTPGGAVLVGGFGGNGRYVQTDGEFSTRRAVYIGGATTNEMRRTHVNIARLEQYHDAQGSVRVLGGSFSTLQNIVLGRDGTGTLELSGTGTVTAAAIVVSNTLGQAASTLKFTADANGRCGVLAPSTALKFYDGARFVVDVSANPLKRAKVLDLAAPPEGLSADRIELVGAEDVVYPHRLEISADCRQIIYTVDRGMRIILQ